MAPDIDGVIAWWTAEVSSLMSFMMGKCGEV